MLSAQLAGIDRAMVVGDEPMVLSGAYDPDQMWFEFMRGTIFPQQDEPEARPLPKNWMKHLNRHKIVSSNEDRVLYPYELDVPQFVLPFVEYKKVSNKHWQRLEAKRWPAWARTSEGELLTLDVRVHLTKATELWLFDNCAGRFRVNSGFVTFERERDYMLAMLRFR